METLADETFGNFLCDDEIVFEEMTDNDDDELSKLMDVFDEEMFTENVAEPGREQTEAPPTNAPPPPTPKQRFASVSDTEIDDLLADASSGGTKKMTKWGNGQFKQWLCEKGESETFEEDEAAVLDRKLEKFYVEVRNQDGRAYGKSTFVGLRAAINRHIRGPPYNRDICIMKDKPFHKSNQVFVAMLKKLKRDGLDQTRHYPAIDDGDLVKMRKSLQKSDPKTLQRKVWFDISLLVSFARRGRENLREMKKDAFIFKTDDIGSEYVEMRYNEATKNHPGNENDTNGESKTRMYETKENDCPVQSLKLYLRKLNPENEVLFQQPKQYASSDDTIWYTTRPVGPRTLNDMMKSISKDAKLSREYTNHSVRATTVTLLSHAGVDTRNIMQISKHRNESSVRSYNRDCSAEQKRQYSAILSTSGRHQAQNIDEEQTNSTVTPPTDSNSSFYVPVMRPATPLAQSQNHHSNQGQGYFNNQQSVQNHFLVQSNAHAIPQSLAHPSPYNISNCTVTINNYKY